MELITKLENMVAGWLKPIPSLPKNVQKWLAENVWWLALISAILTGIGILMSLGAIATYASYSSSLDVAYGIGLASYAPGWIVSVVVSLVFSVITVLLTAIAIKPLKELNHKGWSLLFVMYLINAVSVVVNAVVNFTIIGFIFGIIFGAVGLAIGGYFLFQIKSYFGSHAKAKHVTK
jgi:uncharacterized membrane protein YhaH (DUF805 family)